MNEKQQRVVDFKTKQVESIEDVLDGARFGREKLEKRFGKFVEKKGDDECWTWIGSTNKGYAGFSIRDRQFGAHRIAFMFYYGRLSSTMQACHSCDNPLCVNPRHIFQGTVQDNKSDCVKKGRTAKGEKQGSSKLTKELVIKMRTEWSMCAMRQKDVAIKYGVSRSQARRIVFGESWKHLPL